ncbi:MAG: hypothetical protein ACYC0N_00710 [Carboxydocellales bacterium]
MKVYEMIERLLQLPAGARVFVSTKKDINDLLSDNLSDNEEVANITFLVKSVGKSGDDIYLNF